MACLLAVLVPIGYFVLTVHTASSIVLVALAYVTVVAYTVLTTMLSMAENVWFKSMNFRWCFERNDQLAKKRIGRKYEKFLKPLKVKIGSINFVERNTPFVFLSLCVQETINLVLVQK
jgi:hypothetical protein